VGSRVELFEAIRRDTIFQAYARAETRAPGTGVGLAICKAIIERHTGCAISAASPQGGGAEIRFTLPLRQD
jgi:two-component system, OmpR family, sensor histidine kinase KdpD